MLGTLCWMLTTVCGLTSINISSELALLEVQLAALSGQLSRVNDAIKPLSWKPKEQIIDIINDIEDAVIKEAWKEINPNQKLPEDLEGVLWELELYNKPDALEKIIKSIPINIENKKDLLKGALEPANSQALNALLQILNRTIKAGIMGPFESEPITMSWCPCTRIGERIYFVLLLLNDITAKFKDPNELLTYISLGSGSLLQDTITFIELIHAGYKNFELNFVELDFPDIPLLARTEEERIDRIHQDYLQGKRYSPEQSAQLIELFKTKIAQEFSALAIDGVLNVNVYRSVYDYLPKAKKYPKQKSDILVMVDPGHGVFAEADYPSQANAFKILFGENNWLVGFLPLDQKPQLYAKTKDTPKDIASKIDLVKKILEEADLQGNYRPKIFKQLVDSKIVDETYDQIWQGVMEFEESEDESEGESEEESPGQQELKVLQIGPHLTFQDLVRDAAADVSVIYTLTHPGTVDPPKPRPRRIDRSSYLKEDVVTPNNGLFYKSEFGFTRIL